MYGYEQRFLKIALSTPINCKYQIFCGTLKGERLVEPARMSWRKRVKADDDSKYNKQFQITII